YCSFSPHCHKPQNARKSCPVSTSASTVRAMPEKREREKVSRTFLDKRSGTSGLRQLSLRLSAWSRRPRTPAPLLTAACPGPPRSIPCQSSTFLQLGDPCPYPPVLPPSHERQSYCNEEAHTCQE